MYTPRMKEEYSSKIVPNLIEKFGYSTPMRAPKLEKIVLSQGLGKATTDKKVLEVALEERH